MKLGILALFLIAGLGTARGAGPARIRVVSQTVGTDELLLAVAAPGQIAALSHLATDPQFCAVAEEARAYPQLQLNGDAESVIKFSPTLVLCADYSRPELVAQIRRAGVEVLVFDRYLSLGDAYANLRVLAGRLGTGRRAEELIAGCQARVGELRARLEGVRKVRVIAPSTYGLLPGAGTTFQDLCDNSGAENLAFTLGRLSGHAPQPSEQMLDWPVDFVVVSGGEPGAALAPFRAIPPYEYMAAVKEGRAVLLPPYALGCVSHYRIRAYEIMARALHPEAFR
jgi:iron complex transport system substrate-binding protein